VNGRELHASDNLYEFFDGTAGKQTVLHIAYNPDGKDARDVTVVPIDDEDGLRNLDWIEANRRKVDELSGGKVAYVYMPNTGGSGYTNFNRYFYSQLDKQALVLDERYNEGGFIADYVVDVLKRFPLSGAIERDGKPIHDPVGAIFGPKVMLINQNSGSGGDAMPWYFRKAGIGKLVGTRTWGGLVGIGGYPSLLDGGYVTAPRYAIYGLTATGRSRTTALRPTCRRGAAQRRGRRPRPPTRNRRADGAGRAEGESGAGDSDSAVSELPQERRVGGAVARPVSQRDSEPAWRSATGRSCQSPFLHGWTLPGFPLHGLGRLVREQGSSGRSSRRHGVRPRSRRGWS
jgi:hypothetical protein